MNTRKIIGLLCWLGAFIIPFRISIMDAYDLHLADGGLSETSGNLVGLVYFVVFVTLVFTGYALVDGSSRQQQSEGHGH